MGFWENGILGKWDFEKIGFWVKKFRKRGFWEKGSLGKGTLGRGDFEKRGFGENEMFGEIKC